MDSIKGMLYAVCIIAMIDKIVNILSGDKYQAQMRLITTLVMILCAASQFEGGIYIPDITYYDEELESAESSAMNDYYDVIKDNIAENLKKVYQQQGISLKDIVIACSFDEYKYINVTKIMLYNDNEDITDEELIGIAYEYFPQAQIMVVD